MNPTGDIKQCWFPVNPPFTLYFLTKRQTVKKHQCYHKTTRISFFRLPNIVTGEYLWTTRMSFFRKKSPKGRHIDSDGGVSPSLNLQFQRREVLTHNFHLPSMKPHPTICFTYNRFLAGLQTEKLWVKTKVNPLANWIYIVPKETPKFSQ